MHGVDHAQVAVSLLVYFLYADRYEELDFLHFGLPTKPKVSHFYEKRVDFKEQRGFALFREIFEKSLLSHSPMTKFWIDHYIPIPLFLHSCHKVRPPYIKLPWISPKDYQI